MTKITRLARAADLIESVLNELDTSYRICDGCGLKHYANIDERKQGNKLEGMLKSITGVRAAMAQKEGP